MTKDEISGWLLHPVTEAHINRLKEAKEMIRENWSRGDYTAESNDGTAQLNSTALGAIQQIEEILIDIENMEFADEL